MPVCSDWLQMWVNGFAISYIQCSRWSVDLVFLKLFTTSISSFSPIFFIKMVLIFINVIYTLHYWIHNFTFTDIHKVIIKLIGNLFWFGYVWLIICSEIIWITWFSCIVFMLLSTFHVPCVLLLCCSNVLVSLFLYLYMYFLLPLFSSYLCNTFISLQAISNPRSLSS